MRWACRTLLPARATGVPSKMWVPWRAQRRINGHPLARFKSFQLCSQWRAIDSVCWLESPWTWCLGRLRSSQLLRKDALQMQSCPA